MSNFVLNSWAPLGIILFLFCWGIYWSFPHDKSSLRKRVAELENKVEKFENASECPEMTKWQKNDLVFLAAYIDQNLKMGEEIDQAKVQRILVRLLREVNDLKEKK